MQLPPLMMIATILLLSGCSDSDKSERSNRDNVWKSQTQAIEKARSTEEEVRKAFEQRNREMEQQSR